MQRGGTSLVSQVVNLTYLPTLLLVVLAAACAASSVERSPDDTAVVFKTPDSATGSSDAGRLIEQEASTPAGKPFVDGAVYAHSDKTLYRVDIRKDATTVTRVSAFAGIGKDDSMIDLALNQNSEAYGVTFSELYKVNLTTAACTKVATGSFPNSLSFVPAGTLDPNVEALVGYNGSDYVRIALNGTISVVRINALGDGFFSSGDVVAVAGKAFLTVRASTDCTSANCKQCQAQDCIVQINPTTGQVLEFRGGVGRQNVYGLAFWAGTAYGFSEGGGVFSVDLEAKSLSGVSIAFDSDGKKLSFYGAGSTTSAPVASVK